ncbi:MAG TPA: short-chain dehydrogenase [Gammaproteobacteria bacterium]|jgi:NAD(P)-dependent dehydrogenase (short-subunit alcohol dehydrogenase family)|nr:short-chain dehydrogenase [Acidiferrobacteraceae bacterium]MDP6398360.1 SDR family oxidoreductase [Arenicellales bacterium]HCX88178.1 short-chain dehydrogenase [Gammaproteobacteria bacterium]MDP6550655.1 SDR family oxidoreductase [Arenicellales bacterium]MDP6791294.1 SDR family oxidoreductase [Arenicellales bacterium]|tara:strand:+ start:803 stop:1498 length:696 start_codon:yes stop_codon:yes gene_type:complete
MSHTVFITGTTRGIGLELTRQFLNAGSHVFATARDPGSDALQSLKAEHGDQLQLLALDVTDCTQIAKAAATLDGQPLDLLINNAGLFRSRSDDAKSLSHETWLQEFHVNAIAPFMVTRALQGNLAAADDALVAMISSKMGSMSDNTSGGAYSYRSSKAALNAVAVSLARDLADDGTRVVALHPGWVRTDMGGANALVDAQTSAEGLKNLMLGIDAAQNGGFFDYTGAPIPW